MFALFVTALFWHPSLSTTAEFLKPESILSEKPNQVTLGLIMVNIKKQSRTTEELFKERLDALVLSLTHHSTVPILLIVVTDPGTLSGVVHYGGLGSHKGGQNFDILGFSLQMVNIFCTKKLSLSYFCLCLW